MKEAIRNGLRNSGLFYGSSIALTIIVHTIIGWQNESLYPKSAVVVIFVVLVAIPWAILNISNLICPIKRPRNAGELIAHLVFFGSIAIALNVMNQ